MSSIIKATTGTATWTTACRPRSLEPVFTHQGTVMFRTATEADAFFWILVEEIESGRMGPDAWVGWDEFLVTPTEWRCTSKIVDDFRAAKRQIEGCIPRDLA